MVKEKNEKEKIILEIVNQLRTLPAAQIVVMFQIIQAVGTMAVEFSEAVRKAGGPVGIQMSLVREAPADGKQVDFKS